MFALIFLSLGGALPFLQDRSLSRKGLPLLIGLTLAGSLAGAKILEDVPSKIVPLIIAVAMIAIAIFSLANRKSGVIMAPNPGSPASVFAGLAATLALGFYGGFFSGGYVTLLTAAYVAFFRFTFLQAIAVTKVLNVFSSLVATLLFARDGLVDWKVGLPLAVASFLGGILGAVIARRTSNLWLRRIFLSVVLVLAVKTLVFDVSWVSLSSNFGAAAHKPIAKRDTRTIKRALALFRQLRLRQVQRGASNNLPVPVVLEHRLPGRDFVNPTDVTGVSGTLVFRPSVR